MPVRHRIARLATVLAVGAAGAGLIACSGTPAPRPGHLHETGVGRSVTDLVDRSTVAPDLHVRLVARASTIALSNGQTVDGWTFGGAPVDGTAVDKTALGPQITVREGDLVEVTVHNEDVADGVTVHWHGVDVPNAMDGVAGVTQDAIPPGGDFTYRFRPPQAGTFWYHTHQRSSAGVVKGLFGAFVVLPADAPEMSGEAAGIDEVLLAHIWRTIGRPDVTTVGRNAGQTVRTVAAGTPVRLRLVNTDSLQQHWSVAGTDFTVAAIDGTDVNEPTPIRGQTLTLGGGGRFDVVFVMPDHAVTVGILDRGGPRYVLRPPGAAGGAESDDAPDLSPGPPFDPLVYGRPAPVPFTMTTHYDVDEVQKLETQRSFVGGMPKTHWTINGRRAPDIPMIMVGDGDLVRVHLINASDTVHPMHLHGHHVLVLEFNDVAASGSPWWADTVNLQPGDDAWVAFRADNPGIWMDHCHNLDHAAAGMLMHVGYRGVHTPFEMSGYNKPE